MSATGQSLRGGHLAPMEIASRMPRVQGLLEEGSLDALVVTDLSNVRYLTGFTGSAATLVVTGAGATVTTDGRYRTQVESELSGAGVTASVEIGGAAEQREALSSSLAGCRRVGLEAASVSWAFKRSLAELLDGTDLVATSGLVERLRRVKDEGEVSRIEAAASIADAALGHVAGLLGEGVTEGRFAATLDMEMRTLGASGSAFETIVASGPNAAMPHARPGGRRIGRGELVVVDFGAVVEGYRSDMTRTLCAGEPASALGRRVVEVVAESQAAGVGAVRPGVAAAEVDAACREVIGQAGWADAFVHGTGHGVGLDIHEAPALGSLSADILELRSVVTVEPGVYLRGELGQRLGSRIEDTVVVTPDGCRALTRYPKDLVVG